MLASKYYVEYGQNRRMFVLESSEARDDSDGRETAGACQVIRGAPIATSHPDVVCVNLNKFS